MLCLLNKAFTFHHFLWTSGFVCIEECPSQTKGYIWTEVLLSVWACHWKQNSLQMTLHVLWWSLLSWELTTALSGHQTTGSAKAEHSFLSLQRMHVKVRLGLIIWVFCRGAHNFSMGLLLKWHTENFTVGFFSWDSTTRSYNIFVWTESNVVFVIVVFFLLLLLLLSCFNHADASASLPFCFRVL